MSAALLCPLPVQSEMSKILFLLLLGAFVLVLIQAQEIICMTCNVFVNGKCIEGGGKCTMEEGGACRTRHIYRINARGGFFYNHTVLECSKSCKASRETYFHLKISTFCCKSQNFCNKYRGM
ncbi:secreted seminal-vesicle Ly-6 protein 1-like [Grammomys surdaster]|uniref:secreted seminal-vesicle Ly-6 protein 1-like n=1 Tax=Grammomys surdaster TaxID=491861 RepID=UPI00109EF639|nr:secreted seminal-vesicle Ly-6 protein 1-like [Grammomys surdaster]